MGDLSAYEQERLSRIQDNQKFLQALGLGAEKKLGIFTDPEPAIPRKFKKKKDKKHSDDFVPRRSSRARSSVGSSDGGSSQDPSLEDEYDDDDEPTNKKKGRDLGVRVVWGRTYDPINGTTCHQCRQKTLELKVACTNIVEDYYGNKQMCNVKLDEACLTNRYGQTIEAALANGEWKCPKCLGVCNCSFCRRKKGLTPTGKARAAGYDSVDAYLRNGPPSTKKNGRGGRKPKPEIAKVLVPSTPRPPAELPLPNLNADNVVISSEPSEFAISDLLTHDHYSPNSQQLIYSDASFSTPNDPTFTPDFTPTSTPGDYTSLSDFSSSPSEYNPYNFEYPHTPFQPADISQLHLNGVDDPVKMDVPTLDLLPDISPPTITAPDIAPTEPKPTEVAPTKVTPTTTPTRTNPTRAVTLNGTTPKGYTPNGTTKTPNGTTSRNKKNTPETNTPEKIAQGYAPDEFDVEKILDMKVKKRKDGKEAVFYLVQWQGNMEDSWEPATNLFCNDLLDSFRQTKQANGGGPHKKSSPKRKQEPASPTEKDAKKIKGDQQAEEMATPGKRANRGTRHSQLTDYHFF